MRYKSKMNEVKECIDNLITNGVQITDSKTIRNTLINDLNIKRSTSYYFYKEYLKEYSPETIKSKKEVMTNKKCIYIGQKVRVIEGGKKQSWKYGRIESIESNGILVNLKKYTSFFAVKDLINPKGYYLQYWNGSNWETLKLKGKIMSDFSLKELECEQ